MPTPIRLLRALHFLKPDQKPDQTFSPVALIDRRAQRLQFLVLIGLHRLQVGVPMDLLTAKAVTFRISGRRLAFSIRFMRTISLPGPATPWRTEAESPGCILWSIH
jgi:hypothetical protein